MGIYCDYDEGEEVCYSYEDPTPSSTSEPPPDTNPDPISPSIDIPETGSNDSTPVQPSPDSTGSVNDRSAGASDGNAPTNTTNAPRAASPFSLFDDAHAPSPYFLIDPKEIADLSHLLGDAIRDASQFYGFPDASTILLTGKNSLSDSVPSEESLWWGLTGAAVLAGSTFILEFPFGAATIDTMGDLGFELGMGSHELYEDILNRSSAVDSIFHDTDSQTQVDPSPAPSPSASPDQPRFSNMPDIFVPGSNRLK
jgi:hypothetical protein